MTYRTGLTIVATLLLLATGMRADETIFAPGQKPTMLLEQGAGEGPAWHPQLGLLFSGDNRISRRDSQGNVHVFRDQSGSNGLLFDAQGRLLVCEPRNRRVTRTEPDGRITVLTADYRGQQYNQPNDITVDSQDRIYFSDPRYGSRDDMRIFDRDGRPVEGVYRIDADGTVERIITHEVDRPNGLVVSADDRFLFVADNNNNSDGGARKLWRFNLNADGRVDLASQKLLFDWQTGRGPDGMVLDQRGRLYVAGGLTKPQPPYETADEFKGGVYVVSPDGGLLDFAAIPRDEVTNCTFGGPDLKTLFITAGGTLWSIPTETAGRLPWPKP